MRSLLTVVCNLSLKTLCYLKTERWGMSYQCSGSFHMCSGIYSPLNLRTPCGKLIATLRNYRVSRGLDNFLFFEKGHHGFSGRRCLKRSRNLQVKVLGNYITYFHFPQNFNKGFHTGWKDMRGQEGRSQHTLIFS